MKILVASDLHLSSRVWRHRPIEGDSYYAWLQVVEYAVDLAVDAVILAGDVLDKQANLSEPIAALVSGIERLIANGVAVYYIQGQHEMQQTPWLALNHAAMSLHRNEARFNDLHVVGHDYASEAVLKEWLASEQVRQANVLVCHQVWQDFMGGLTSPQAEFSDIPDGIDLLITGDFHEHIKRKVVRKSGKALCVLSPGSTHMRSIAEPTSHCIFLLDTASATDAQFAAGFDCVSLPLKSRQCCRIDIREFKDDDTINGEQWLVLVNTINRLLVAADSVVNREQLPDEIKMPLLHVTHCTNQHAIVKRITEEWQLRAHLFFKPVRNEDGGEVAAVAEVAQLGDGTPFTLRACLDEFVDKNFAPDAYALAETLIATATPAIALQQWLHGELQRDLKSN